MLERIQTVLRAHVGASLAASAVVAGGFLLAPGLGLAFSFLALVGLLVAADPPRPGGAARSPTAPRPASREPGPDARGRALVVVQTLSVAVADERELSRLACAERLRADGARAMAARALLAGDRETARRHLARKLEADRVRERLERELEAQRAEVRRLEPALERAASEVRLERAAEIRLTRAEARRVTVLHGTGLAGESFASGEVERRADRLEAEAEVLERAFSPDGEERWDALAVDEEERKLEESFGPRPTPAPPVTPREPVEAVAS